MLLKYETRWSRAQERKETKLKPNVSTLLEALRLSQHAVEDFLKQKVSKLRLE